VGVGSVKSAPVDNGLKPIAVSRPLTPPSASSIKAEGRSEGEGFRAVPPGTSADSYLRVPDAAARSTGKSDFMNVTPAPGVIPAASARTAAAAGAAAAPSVRSYDVESYLILDGDTYDAIAASVYKNRELGPALARYNRWNGVSSDPLTPGRRVLLPPETVLTTPERTAAPRLLPTPSRSAASPAGAGPTYTVDREETLYSIAKRTLGDGKRWREIYKLNTDRLGSEFDVPVGVTLRLPMDGTRR
jgi:nucleoid-associated protein YgaU